MYMIILRQQNILARQRESEDEYETRAMQRTVSQLHSTEWPKKCIRTSDAHK